VPATGPLPTSSGEGQGLFAASGVGTAATSVGFGVAGTRAATEAEDPEEADDDEDGDAVATEAAPVGPAGDAIATTAPLASTPG
jgi:hypothetical protein